MTEPSTVLRDLAPTGRLRASINLGNAVLAQGTPDRPSGITVDLARELGARLGADVEFRCVDAARDSLRALVEGAADVAFLAREPAREQDVAFTAAYAVIEGAYAVPVDSELTALEQVDRPGVDVGVKLGSAYDLFLTRTLQHATVVRGTDGIVAFREHGLAVAAGIRAPLAAAVAEDAGLRLLDGAFMQIHQAVAVRRDSGPATLDLVRGLVEELKASGFVADSLRRSGQASAAVAPPAR